jgi:hypothetical protein
MSVAAASAIINSDKRPVATTAVIARHSASKDARKRAYDPAIHPGMDPRVRPAGDGRGF